MPFTIPDSCNAVDRNSGKNAPASNEHKTPITYIDVTKTLAIKNPFGIFFMDMDLNDENEGNRNEQTILIKFFGLKPLAIT